MSGADQKSCLDCLEVKDRNAFKSPKTGIEYDVCNVCFLKKWKVLNAAFWKTKVFKNYKCCNRYIEIDRDGRDADGCPYSKCKSCRYAEKRAQYEAENAKRKSEDGESIKKLMVDEDNVLNKLQSVIKVLEHLK